MNKIVEIEKNGYSISDDASRIEVSVVHAYLSKQSY